MALTSLGVEVGGVAGGYPSGEIKFQGMKFFLNHPGN